VPASGTFQLLTQVAPAPAAGEAAPAMTIVPVVAAESLRDPQLALHPELSRFLRTRAITYRRAMRYPPQVVDGVNVVVRGGSFGEGG
jgi:hypothetical protein